MPNFTLLSVYTKQEPEFTWFATCLYEFLKSRKSHENISHREMPTFKEHINFIKSHPYHEWYLIQDDNLSIIGALYITQKSEIGLFIQEQHRRQGYASAVLEWVLREYHDEELFANINPNNQASIDLFAKYGFEYIQNTYRRDPSV